MTTRNGAELVEVVVPVHNEAQTLEATITRLRDYLDRSFPFPTVFTIADNASVDGTDALARGLAARLEGVHALHLDQKGRGLALRTSWIASRAKVVAYMDADLATGLEALLPLVAPLLSGHSDIAIGTRLAGGAHVVRGPKRELISRCYNALLRVVLGSQFSDAQCGFKAMRADAVKILLPLVVDNDWFFDTELLVLAERNGMRIHEVPVDWIDDPDSRVDVVRTSLDDLRGIWRLLTTPHMSLGAARPGSAPTSQAASLVTRFAGVGILSTVAYVALFLIFGHWLGRYGANALALALCTAANTWAHARLATPGAAPPSDRDVLVTASTLFGVILGLTSAGLALANVVDPSSKLLEVAAIAVATAAAALLRFVVVHAWSFRRHYPVLGTQVTAAEESAA